MTAIHILDPGLSNRIAAGEVVERPASVVKELIENSIDAQATHIRVAVEEAGMKTIRVVDDGTGMDREDAELALRRHATSKIASERDLFRIRTLGFRGEALPSIAAVSKLVLKTRRREDDAGTEIRAEGGTIVSTAEVGMAPGTDIFVEELFFNTPARLKYIKSLDTEGAHVVDAVTRAALAHPEVAFTLSADGRPVATTPGDGRLLHAVAALYGRDLAEKCIPVEERGLDLRVWGLAGLPEIHRAGRGHVMFFVNGRPVRNPALTRAVLDVYAGRLPIHRNPVVFLHLELDPGLVDPNVHPAKLDVRFSEERDVAGAVERALGRVLDRARAIPGLHSPTGGPREGRNPPRQGPDAAAGDAAQKAHRGSGAQILRESQMAFRWDSPPGGGRSPSSPLARRRTLEALAPITAEEQPEAPGEREGETGSRSSLGPEVPVDSERTESNRTTEEAAATVELEGVGAAGVRPRVPELRAVAQVLNLYIVAEAENSLFLIDQHAAHEKILYERFSRQITRREVSPMPLLVPITVELSVAEMHRLAPHLDMMKEYGLTAEPFGDNALVVRTVPDIWDGQDVTALTREFLTEYVERPIGQDPRRRLEQGVITRACRGAVKAGQPLSMPEMQALCDQLRELDNPFSCPHGRPTILQWTRRDLDRQFQRIQH
ncbi:DNA mismatch repair endonuclease MutL [Kyrpidia spormannii]|uniref:DNA mismatch repair protein MutL n=2 Tax=Kyrpidia spormannii TaxID=2055160 RepID=A0ACA8Z959_9BACL|nr:DNA mismatch repair endonuclease MutL [Kyrpidia spormannii]CAB3392270.1 DNA mismatch repair protein MutL [Kyrpidia spormannii]CAB3393192.1 DNA mismatch repair protein MutL [Kyrpidia spormannii]